MPGHPSSDKTRNRILARLSGADFALLEPYLKSVDLPLRKNLELPKRRIENVYFIDSGFASVVANGHGDRSIEVGLIGREGLTGLAVIMGTDRSPNATYMQNAGAGREISVAKLGDAIRQSETLRRTLLNYGHAFFIQTSQTALANGRNKNEERLARWLCMAHDRGDSDELVLTHQFISIMLGVQRPHVTVTLAVLEKAGLIEVKRGVISILDRKGLEKRTRGAYGAPEAEFQRLFG